MANPDSDPAIRVAPCWQALARIDTAASSSRWMASFTAAGMVPASSEFTSRVMAGSSGVPDSITFSRVAGSM